MDPIPPRERPLLRRIAECFVRMNQVRQVSELSSHNALGLSTNFRINESGIKLKRATPVTHDVSSRIYLFAFVDFVSECFEEFATLSTMERWTIIHNCFELILFLDGIYRSERDFPNDPNLIYGHMTTVFDPDDVDDIFGDPTAHTPLSLERLKKILRQGQICDRTVMKGVDAEEFYAILGLVLWNTEDCSMTERVVHIFEKNRRAALKELHAYYASVDVHDYAVRIGKLFHAINTVKSGVAEFRNLMDTLRVLNVIGDDTFYFPFMRRMSSI